MDGDLETRYESSTAKIDEIRSKQKELHKRFSPQLMKSYSNKELETYLANLDYWQQELQNQYVILNEAKDRLQQGTTATEKIRTVTEKLMRIAAEKSSTVAEKSSTVTEKSSTVAEKSSKEIPTIKLSQTQIDVWMKALEEVKNKNKELISTVTELIDQNTILRSACDTLNKQVTKLDEKCTNLNTAYNTQNEQITNLVEDNRNLNEQVTNLHRAMDNVNARYEEIIQRLPPL